VIVNIGGAKSKTLGYIPELKDVYGRFIDKFNGHALHANKISFIHPSTKKNVNFELDIPNRFYDLINSIKLIYER
jgi:Pseudouridylate synthases, 23S RNA-specific